MSGKKNEESWLSDNKIEKSFFDIKKPVLSVLQRVGINSYQTSEITDGSRFSYGIKIHRGPVTIAEFGEVKKTLCRKMGIKAPLFYAEISFDVLLTLMGKEKMQVKEISRFPSVRRDLAIVVDKKVRFSEIETIGRQTEKKLLKQISLFDVYENEKQLGISKKSYAVSFVFEDTEKTLQDKDIDQIMEKLIHQLEAKTGALIRK